MVLLMSVFLFVAVMSVAVLFGSSGFLVDVRPTPAPSCSFCGTGIDHCAL